MAELKSITDQGVPAPNLIVSERAQLLMPYHVLQDSYEEERLAGKAFGSTKSGIAPFYSDKYAKIGIQLCDLFDEKRLMERLTAACDLKNVLFEHLYHKPPLDPQSLFDELMEHRELIRPYVGDAVTFVHEALKAGKTILLEGQLGSMKDPDLGIFPMTTSSHTLAGFGTVGACIPPTAMEDVFAVTKAYSSCVGSKTEPFVSEVEGEAGDELRRRGGDKGEFGATTGRPRRVGWLTTISCRKTPKSMWISWNLKLGSPSPWSPPAPSGMRSLIAGKRLYSGLQFPHRGIKICKIKKVSHPIANWMGSFLLFEARTSS